MREESLFGHAVKVCKELKPRLVIVENVAGFFMRFKRVYLKLAWQLEKLGCVLLNKHDPMWNTREHGVPQSRSRVILIGVLPLPGESVAWTPPAPLLRCPKLALFVDGAGANVEAGAAICVIDAALKARGRVGPEQDFVIELGASERFRTLSENFCPTLTASWGQDPEEVVRSLCAGMPLKVRQSAFARVSPTLVSPTKGWKCRRRLWPPDG